MAGIRGKRIFYLDLRTWTRIVAFYHILSSAIYIKKELDWLACLQQDSWHSCPHEDSYENEEEDTRFPLIDPGGKFDLERMAGNQTESPTPSLSLADTETSTTDYSTDQESGENNSTDASSNSSSIFQTWQPQLPSQRSNNGTSLTAMLKMLGRKHRPQDVKGNETEKGGIVHYEGSREDREMYLCAVYFDLSVYILQGIVAGMLFYGAQKGKPCLLLAWLSFNGVLLLAFMLVFLYVMLTTLPGMSFLLLTLRIGTEVFAYWVVAFHRRELILRGSLMVTKIPSASMPTKSSRDIAPQPWPFY